MFAVAYRVGVSGDWCLGMPFSGQGCVNRVEKEETHYREMGFSAFALPYRIGTKLLLGELDWTEAMLLPWRNRVLERDDV